MAKRIAVFASGNGSNFQVIAEQFPVEFVFSDHRDGDQKTNDGCTYSKNFHDCIPPDHLHTLNKRHAVPLISQVNVIIN